MKTNVHFSSYLAQFFLEWEMFQTKVAEKIKTHISCSVTFFFSKIVPFMRKSGNILWNRAGHRWQYGACALHAGYLRLQIHSRRLFNANCFSTLTMVARTPLNVTLFLHFLPCCFYYVRCLCFMTCGISTWYLSRIIRRDYLELLRFEIYGSEEASLNKTCRK